MLKRPPQRVSYIEKKEDSTSMLTILAFKNKNKRKFSRKIVINYEAHATLINFILFSESDAYCKHAIISSLFSSGKSSHICLFVMPDAK